MLRCEFRGAARSSVFVCGVLAVGFALAIGRRQGIGEPKVTPSPCTARPALPADFTHMPYANPDAPKGGRLVQGILGTFDSLNPLIVRGLAVQQIRGFVDREPDGARQ